MTSGFHGHARLPKNTTEFARRMSRLSSRIFGEVVLLNAARRSLKAIQLLLKRPWHKDSQLAAFRPRFHEISPMLQLRDLGLPRLALGLQRRNKAAAAALRQGASFQGVGMRVMASGRL